MKAYSEALADIDFLLNIDDNNACIYFYKGIINRNRGEVIDALKNYDIGNFNQCQTLLIPLYEKGIKGSEIEFLCYRIIYTSYK